MNHFVASIAILMFCQLNHAASYKILVIYPSTSKSHFICAHRLMLELARIGHNVTVLSPHPLAIPPPNYHDLDVPGIHDEVNNKIKSVVDFGKMNRLEQFKFVHDKAFIISNYTLNHPKVQALLNDPNEHFDLVIKDSFMNEAMHGIAHHFKAPIVSISPIGTSIWNYFMVGTPAPMSYCSSYFLPYIGKLTLPQKLYNTIHRFAEFFAHNFYYFPMQERIYNEVFPDPKPTLWELHRNVSLVLLNQHFTLNYPRPYVPNMIEVGGIHLIRNPKPLPPQMQEFVDSAKHGVIYFSLGTNLGSFVFDATKIRALINTFSKLKQNVLWKANLNGFKDLPPNILIQDWFPQEDILAHPNTKLFITHGGVLSLMETVYYRIPVIGIPFFADQEMNMQKVLAEGIGLAITLDDLNESALTAAINEVLSNEKYTENMNSLSVRFRDQPMTPLKTAVYWVEYVARHKGAPHMRSPSQDMNFIQYHNLDAFGILLFVVLFVIYVFKKVISTIFGRKLQSGQSKLKRS